MKKSVVIGSHRGVAISWRTNVAGSGTVGCFANAFLAMTGAIAVFMH